MCTIGNLSLINSSVPGQVIFFVPLAYIEPSLPLKSLKVSFENWEQPNSHDHGCSLQNPLFQWFLHINRLDFTLQLNLVCSHPLPGNPKPYTTTEGASNQQPPPGPVGKHGAAPASKLPVKGLTNLSPQTLVLNDNNGTMAAGEERNLLYVHVW